MASRKTLYLFGGESSPTGTPSIRYSSAEINNSHYHNSANAYLGSPTGPCPDDVPGSSGSLTERDPARPKNLEYRSRWEPRRALSINSRAYIDKNERDSARDGSASDRLKDDSGTLTNSAPTKHKTNYFRPMGMRNNFLNGQQVPQSHQRGTPQPSPFPHRDSGDLVAMGTYWMPLGGQASRTSLNGRPGSRGSNGGGMGGGTNTQQQQFPVSQNLCGPLGGPGPIQAPRKLGSKTAMNPVMGPRQRKEPEPRYSDPLANAPPSFNQRMAEVAALESETLRWEKARKAKKKPKADS